MTAEEKAGLPLSPEEGELVAQEAEALLPRLPEPRRADYSALARSARTGQVPHSLLSTLEGLLVLTLTTGRARSLYRAEGERVLTELYRRTPAGGELARHLERVNRALSALAGRQLRSVRVGWRTLGHYTLRLEVEGVAVSLVVGPEGVRVESLGVGEA